MQHIAKALSIFILIFISGCGVIGYNIEKGIEEEKKPLFDQRGRPLPHPTAHPLHPSIDLSKRQRLAADPNSLTAQGDAIDNEILKSAGSVLFTRRKENDLKMRDEPACLEDEVQVCSITTGCSCKVKAESTKR